MGETQADLCHNTLLIIISRLSFYFNVSEAGAVLCAKASKKYMECNKFIVGSVDGLEAGEIQGKLFTWMWAGQQGRAGQSVSSLMHSYPIGPSFAHMYSCLRTRPDVRSITPRLFDYVSATQRAAMATLITPPPNETLNMLALLL